MVLGQKISWWQILRQKQFIYLLTKALFEINNIIKAISITKEEISQILFK
jgi:hypothetical protein